MKIPYQIVIGENEIKDDVLSVRKYGEKKTESIDRKQFLLDFLEEAKKF